LSASSQHQEAKGTSAARAFGV